MCIRIIPTKAAASSETRWWCFVILVGHDLQHVLAHLGRGSKASCYARSLTSTVGRVARDDSSRRRGSGNSAEHEAGAGVARHDNGGAASLADSIGEWAGCDTRGEGQKRDDGGGWLHLV